MTSTSAAAPLQHINLSERLLHERPELKLLTEALDHCAKQLNLRGGRLYYDFPIFRDETDELLRAELALVDPSLGLVLCAATPMRPPTLIERLEHLDENLDRLFSQLYSRLLRTGSLRKSRTELAVPVHTLLFAPNLDGQATPSVTNSIISSRNDLSNWLERHCLEAPLSPQTFSQLAATFQGARGLIRPKTRQAVGKGDEQDLVPLFDKLETNMAGFDLSQTEGYISELDGPQRIRGLAGSGKTVVLSMKAALTHLRDPKARILYTFHTKSLYQHVKRTITKFYREYDDRDPDWDRIVIQHSWGGPRLPGVYYEAAVSHRRQPLNFRDAKVLDKSDPLGAVCTSLMSMGAIKPLYDYVFIDEGQDFSPPFIRLCAKLAQKQRFVLAYDELQTIFRPTAPSARDIFGANGSGSEADIEFTRDIVLPVCYRNPREVLVVAHAVGFGVYGELVQLLEDREHWETIGYRVEQGNFRTGEATRILRPPENSLATVSDALDATEIIKATAHKTFGQEIQAVAKEIRELILAGVRPDDVLVAVVDDRSAKEYLKQIGRILHDADINTNDIHTDVYGVPEFSISGEVTLSTVHKAKGNEAFVVFVVGADALFDAVPTVQDRNLLFTAITRAKALVRVSGVGHPAQRLCEEIQTALSKFPYLEFTYPGPGHIRQLRKDWKRTIARKGRAEDQIEKLLQEFEPEEVIEMLKRRSKQDKSSEP